MELRERESVLPEDESGSPEADGDGHAEEVDSIRQYVAEAGDAVDAIYYILK